MSNNGMSLERWATFSVNDHTAKKAFVSEVLLYDKLVIPYPPENDKAEWKRWARKGWNPAWLENCFEELGPLKEAIPWDEYRRQQFADRWKAARQVGQDAYYTTKMLLQQAMAAKGGVRVRPVIPYTRESFSPQRLQRVWKALSSDGERVLSAKEKL